ncbi:MAG: hypothetical protein AAGC77_11085 [Pseudomonadota bacterium]
MRNVVIGCLGLLAVACATPSVQTPVADGSSEPNDAPPSTPVFQTGDIDGQPIRIVDERLGAPALTRKEGDGEFRRYSLETCNLIVIFYPDELGVVRAAHVDATARSVNQDAPSVKDCLARG